ncbi:E3 ubiquitin-protein ligase Praja-2 isoform X2 [Chanos chanos]|uniref:RING-type E3 ubiquitin transferase n=1 Tax=Chanos chanos TaxID=29144 RepID=A0A6J2UZI4_CHACN|nr:E3 ubiquitin-protein ligase Praja-2 isoform X2 [Chanos chanos]
MGQEAGKSAWPRPASGYQTITGRRYGRRHAYVSFRPTPSKRRGISNIEWQEMEMNNVCGEQTIASKGNISLRPQVILPLSSPNLIHPELTSASDKDTHHRKRSPRRQSIDDSSSHHKTLKSCQVAACDMEHYFDLEEFAEASGGATAAEESKNPSKTGVLSLVNMDAYEPDSSGSEEEGLGPGQRQNINKRLDSMICGLERDFEYLNGLHSYLHAKSCNEMDYSHHEVPSESLTETIQQELVSPRTVRVNDELSQVEKCSVPASVPADSLKGVGLLGEEETAQSEIVVRPKIRKRPNDACLNKSKCPQVEETHGKTGRKLLKRTCGSTPPLLLRSHRPNTQSLLDTPPAHCSELSSWGRRREEAEAECYEKGKTKDYGDENDYWEDLEDLNEKCPPPAEDEESSECSEGEWSASWTSESGLEKERASSEESWETLPGLDELQSSSSSLEDTPQLNLTPGELTTLEEGEIPWFICNEETGSSSDEDPEGVSQFVHPGLFLLDSNNNLEDDSSVSEDLDTEWRLLDDLEGDLAIAQALSYADPQQLAEAMEAALAHLESLAIDVEQAHPPATENVIECLPQITVLDEHSGQEQCCAICCCEYVSDEIVTQLPCQHMFHKLCVTLWLRKSGTCPVCRHVLTPALTEPRSFMSDQDSSATNHSTAGTR